MPRKNKTWLDRLEEIDQNDQSRLDKETSSVGIKTIFQSTKRRRSGKQTEKERTVKLTFVVYVFFIIEMCILGGLLLRDSSSSSFGAAIAVIIWSGILSIFSVALGIVALIMRPRLLYMHIPFFFNCLLLFLVFIIFAF